MFFVRFSQMQRGHQRLCVPPNIATSLIATRTELRRYGKVMVAGPLTVLPEMTLCLKRVIHNSRCIKDTPNIDACRCSVCLSGAVLDQAHCQIYVCLDLFIVLYTSKWGRRAKSSIFIVHYSPTPEGAFFFILKFRGFFRLSFIESWKNSENMVNFPVKPKDHGFVWRLVGFTCFSFW